MFNLDPTKLLIVGVVAVLVLGPDKLPHFARQVGDLWRSLNEMRHRVETEVRAKLPDLPPATEIAHLARSPVALIDRLSTMAPGSEGVTDRTTMSDVWDGVGARLETPVPELDVQGHRDVSALERHHQAPVALEGDATLN